MIFDAAGGGGTRGIHVSDFPMLERMAISPPKGGGAPTGTQVEPHASGAASRKSSQTNLSAMQAVAIDEGFLADVSSNSSQLPKPPFLWNPSLWDLGHRPSVSSREETSLRKDPRRGLTMAWLWQTVIWMIVVPTRVSRKTYRRPKNIRVRKAQSNEI